MKLRIFDNAISIKRCSTQHCLVNMCYINRITWKCLGWALQQKMFVLYIHFQIFRQNNGPVKYYFNFTFKKYLLSIFMQCCDNVNACSRSILVHWQIHHNDVTWWCDVAWHYWWHARSCLMATIWFPTLVKSHMVEMTITENTLSGKLT